MNKVEKLKLFSSAFFLGGFLGAAIALLTAPQSGEDTRELIRDKSIEIRDQTMENVEDTRRQAERKFEDISQTTKKKATKLKKTGEKMVEEQKRSLEKGLENARKAVSTN